jgi:tetratricopeptide (TPR) repeat protein
MTEVGKRSLPDIIKEFFALMETEKFAEAEELSRAVIAHSPLHYVGHHLLGTALRFQNRSKQSEQELLEAIRLWPRIERTPDYAAALHQLGLLYQKLGKLDLAFQALNRSVAAAPDLIDAQMALGYLLKEKEGYDRALEHAHKAMQMQPNQPKLYLLQGELFGESGQFESALEAFQTAARLAPDWAMPWYDLAALCVKERKYNEAEGYVREAIRREPQNEEYRALLRSVMAWADWGTPAAATVWSHPRMEIKLPGYSPRDTVPFDRRKVPRIPITGLDQWQEIIDRLAKVTPEYGHLVYRGQIQDWRAGDELSLEPALLRSTRSDEEIESALGLWRLTLEPFLGNVAHRSAGAMTHKGVDSSVYVHPPPFSRTGRLLELIYSPELGGTMQHYGFPTDFLDVTRDPAIALWFALHCGREDERGLITYSRHQWTGDTDFDHWPSIYLMFLPRSQMIDLTDGCISQFTSTRVFRQKAALASCLIYDEPGLKPIPHISTHPDIRDWSPDVVFILKLDPQGDWTRSELPHPSELFPTEDEIYQALLNAGAPDARSYHVDTLGTCVH